MIRSTVAPMRQFPRTSLEADLVVVGGGLSGVCCALTAAREGLKVILVQDRPVLGGNSSSEVRLWVLGATSHMGNNNRWAREGGIIDELLVENTYRNPEGNPIVFDMVLLDKVAAEPNVQLLLNTAVYETGKNEAGLISWVKAFCSQNQTEYHLEAPLFCDASGDGVLGFLSGAAFRMGAESGDEFGEKFTPTADYGELLGHSLYFYTKDTGRPVKFVPPAFALDDIHKIPRFRSFNSKEYGCRLWWIEYGGRLDTVHDTEKIKWELWKVVYGVWNYIKNSGEFPDAETLTLEWVGMIPGKRESRRFEGDYILRQQDIVEQKVFDDAIAYGGWSIDLHPSDGVFSEKPGCNQWHSKGIYSIPFRCLYSRNIANLLFAGRIISASHVAFGSTRVMGTGAYIGQASGMAAVICKRNGILPARLSENGWMPELQRELQRTGQYIPGRHLVDPANLAANARVSASSRLVLEELAFSGWKPLAISVAQMLPLVKGPLPEIEIRVYAEEACILEVEWRVSQKAENYTPETSLGRRKISLQPGEQNLTVAIAEQVPVDCYGFFILYKNTKVRVGVSDQRVTGILSVFNGVNEAVSNYGKQVPEGDIGMDEFEFWCPQRRPEGWNLACRIKGGLDCWDAGEVNNGIARPTVKPNAWVADWKDPKPAIVLDWQEPQTIRKVIIKFDTDPDHPMESVLLAHPESVMPFCVRNYILNNEDGKELYRGEGNYQTISVIDLAEPVKTKQLRLVVEHPSQHTPAAVFEILCYA